MRPDGTLTVTTPSGITRVTRPPGVRRPPPEPADATPFTGTDPTDDPAPF
jgi:hypothetical protein